MLRFYWHSLSLFIWVMHSTAPHVFSQNARLYFDPVNLPKTMSPAVRCIIQDRQGLMWVGTEKGLGRFDGYSWRVFHAIGIDSVSLHEANVWTMYEDRSDNIWIGTVNGGISVLDRTRTQFSHYRHNAADKTSLSNDNVYSLLEDANGYLWAGTEDGLNLIDPSAKSVLRIPDQTIQPDSYKGRVIHSLARDSLGRMWIGSDSGLTVYDPSTKKYSIFSVSDRGRFYEPRRVRRLYADEDGHTMWIGTFGGGLFRWDIRDQRIQQYDVASFEKAYPSNYIRNLVTDRNSDYLWISVRGGGLARLHKPTGEIHHSIKQDGVPLSIPDNAALAVCRDNLGNIWVGFNYDGLAIMNYRKSWFKHIRQIPGTKLVDHTVGAVVVDSVGALLFGVQRAVYRYHPESDHLQSFVMPAHVDNGFNQINSIAEYANGIFWVGTYGNGLYQLNVKNGSLTKYESYPSDAHKRVISLKSYNGYLWIGSFAEVIRIDPVTKKNRIYPDMAKINCFTVVDDTTLIAGSGLSGLYIYNAAQDTFIAWQPTHTDKVWENRTRALFVDDQGWLWQGTFNGLNRIRLSTGEIVRYHTRTDGVPVLNVVDILQSPDKKMWLSTTSGILRLDPGQSDFRYYYKENGLLGNEFSMSAAAMRSDGTMFFGGIQGVTWFRSSDIRDYDYQPSLLITKISKYYQNVVSDLPYRRIEALYDENVLTFEFSVLDYAFLSGIRYAYRLDGFNSEWISTDAHSVTYTNLDPGEYTFRVRGTRGDGTWIDAEAQVQVTIHPPYWLTWWFWSIVASCLGMVTWMGYRMRVRSLLRRKYELQTEVERQTKELHAKNIELQSLNDTKNEFLGMAAHDLRNPLGAVGNIAELMLFEMNPENPETKQTFTDLNRIIQLTERMSYLIHELLDYSAIESGKVSIAVDAIDWAALVRDVCEMNARAASRKKIIVKTEFSDATITLHGDRMRLMSVLDNLVSNAIKYSFAGTEVLIHSVVANHALRVTVHDHGQGLPEADVARAFKSFQKLSAKPTGGESSTGLGLAIIKKIIDLHAGQVWLESELHKGSTFGFSLPLERPSLA